MEKGDEVLIEMEVVIRTGKASNIMVCNDTEEGLKPIISLHALLGTRDSQTIKLQGKIKNLIVMILVDTSSTHNFIDQNMVKRVGFHTQKSLMWVINLCSDVQWEDERVKQQTVCLVLPLKGCDMVLGVQ